MGVDAGVEEEVDRRPAGAGAHAVGGQRAAEVVAAVGVAEVALGFVVARGAGEGEGVVAADGVAHHLEHRLQVAVEELAEQPGARIGVAVEGAGDGGVEVDLAASVEAAAVEGDEVRTLPPGDVEHLDVLAGCYHVVACRAGADGELVDQFAERSRQRRRQHAARVGALDQQAQLAGALLAVHRDPAARGGDDDQQLAAGAERAAETGRGVAVPQAGRVGQLAAVDVAFGQAEAGVQRLGAAVAEQLGDEACAGARGQAEGGQRFTAAAGEGLQFGALPAFDIDYETVASFEGDHGQPARSDAVALQRRGAGEQRGFARSGNHGHVHARLLRGGALGGVDTPGACGGLSWEARPRGAALWLLAGLWPASPRGRASQRISRPP
ncbi:hypothetical protein D3C80_727610 [compost metagenome]